MDATIAYHQQVSYCGKARCKKCREGHGHGPYWYAYQTVNGKTTRTYIGKKHPRERELEQAANELSQDQSQALIRLYTLGRFYMERRSTLSGEWQPVREASWQHQRVRSLLGCLVSAPGRRMGREQLIDALWPDLDIDLGIDRLNRSVHSLRQVFEPSISRPANSQYLLTEREMLILADQSKLWVDASAFEILVDDAHNLTTTEEVEQKLREAVLDVYSGSFLPEEQSSPWSAMRREGLQRKWSSALLELADLYILRNDLQRDDPKNATEMLDRLLKDDPTNESALQRLMILFANSGLRIEAVRAYHRLLEKLDEHEMEPMVQTRRLYKALKRGAQLTNETAAELVSVPGESLAISVPRPTFQIGRNHHTKLVGRARELEMIQQVMLTTEVGKRYQIAKKSSIALDTDRKPQCILLQGDPGIGKTRLSEEIAREALKKGWTVAWSRVYAQEKAVPHRIWIEALRKAMNYSDYSTWQHQDIARNLPRYQTLSRLLPELAERFPKTPGEFQDLKEEDQHRIREAMLEMFTSISDRKPLLIVLDDIQWADESSWQMLSYMTRHQYGRPIAIIATYRENEQALHFNRDLHSAQDLQTQQKAQAESQRINNLINDMKRERSIMALAIEPLNDDQVAEMVNHLPMESIQHIQKRASGNPFFAEELARTLDPKNITEDRLPSVQDMARMLPETINAVLDLRIERLSLNCRKLLQKAAVLDGAFTLQLLLKINRNSQSQQEEDDVLELLEEALSAGVLTEDGSGIHITYNFWHPLLVGRLYDHMSLARKVRLHRSVANALKETHANRMKEGAALITLHLLKGGSEPEEIARFAEMAADHAYDLCAYAEAASHYQFAAEQLEEIEQTQTEDDRMHLAYLLEQLGECRIIQGQFEKGRQLYERVLKLHQQRQTFTSNEEYLEEVQLQALINLEIGKTWYHFTEFALAQKCYAESERLLTSADITVGTVWGSIRYYQGAIFWLQGKYEQASNNAVTALRMFNDALAKKTYILAKPSTRTQRTLNGDPVDIGRAHYILGSLGPNVASLSEAIDHFKKALYIYEQNNRQREIAVSSNNLGTIYLMQAELEMAQEFLIRAKNKAEISGDTIIVALALNSLGTLNHRRGLVNEAENLFKKSIILQEQFNDQIYISLWNSWKAGSQQDQGKFSEATSSLTLALQTARKVSNLPCIGQALIATASLRISQHLADQRAKPDPAFLKKAHYALKKALAFEELETEVRLEGQLLLAQTLFLLLLEEEAKRQAIATMQAAEQSEMNWIYLRCQRLLGEIEASQNNIVLARSFFVNALSAFDECGARIEYARTLQSYGAMLCGLSKPSERKQGTQKLEQARKIFQDYGAAVDLQIIDNLQPFAITPVRA